MDPNYPHDPNNPWQNNPYAPGNNPPQNPGQSNYYQNYQQPYPPPQNQWNQNPFVPNNPFLGQQIDLPNAGGILALGILSIVFAFCYGFVGLILGIIGLVMGNKAMQLYNQNPTAYKESSFNNAKAGRVCSIVGLALGAAFLLFIFVAIASDGFRF